MKKLALVFTILFLIFTLIPFNTFALEEGTETETDAYTEATAEASATFYSRMQEAWADGDLKSLILIFFGILNSVLVIISKKAGNNNSKSIEKSMETNKNQTNAKTNELINATNEAKAASESTALSVEAINKTLQDQKTQDQQSVQELTKKIDNCLVAVTECAKMLQTVYSGSKLPQPVKDMVNNSYVRLENILNQEAKK